MPDQGPGNTADPIYLAWSGGKDSALALLQLRMTDQYHVTRLFTTVTAEYDRTTMHGVRRSLLHMQAEATQLEVIEVTIPAPCPMEEYGRIMGAAMRTARETGIIGVAYGDLFLEDVRAYREERLAEEQLEGIFPLWGTDTAELARRFIDLGFQARLVCVDTEQLDRTFIGRSFDHELLRDLPDHVDPCGENGEFHTFVSAGPIFAAPIPHEVGHVEDRGRFVYCDLCPLPSEGGRVASHSQHGT